MPEDLITLDEASALSKLSREGLYYHARKGSIKIYRRAGERKSYVSKTEVEELIAYKPVEFGEQTKKDAPVTTFSSTGAITAGVLEALPAAS
jgi:hypothetical protein